MCYHSLMFAFAFSVVGRRGRRAAWLGVAAGALVLSAGCGREEAAPAGGDGSGAAGDGAGESVLLRTASAYPGNLPGVGTPIYFVAERVGEVSGGALELKVYGPGELAAPLEILDAVSSGKVDAGYAAAGFWVGKIPAAGLFSSIPFGPEAPEFLAWLLHGNGRALYQEAYDRAGYDAHVIPCAMIAPESSGWFKEEMDSPERLRGLNIRFFGLGAKVMEKLGANPTLLPAGEVFGALEKGRIDAAEFSMPAIDERLGFHKIVKNNYFPGWHQQATVLELLVNGEAWRKLSARHRALLELACLASITNSLAEAEAAQGPAMVRQRDDNGVVFRYWSAEMLAAYRQAWEETAAELRAEDEMFRKAWDDLAAFRAAYDVWEAHAFLPRR